LNGPRHRQAAEAALDQLAWVISYLRRIRKTEIAWALERNHATIRTRLRQRD
jgi:hypothetical protein